MLQARIDATDRQMALCAVRLRLDRLVHGIAQVVGGEDAVREVRVISNALTAGCWESTIEK